jgi:ribose transport system permease protein
MRSEGIITPKENTPSRIFDKLTRSTTVFITLFIILFGAFLSAVSENFLTSYNIGIILRQMSFFGIAALGQTLVLIIGGIDLSVGSTAGLGGIMFAYFLVRMGVNPVVAIFLALAIGALIGFINGLIITKFKLGPFIVTLAISGICSGLILVITLGSTISGITGPVLFLGQGMLNVVPVPVVIFMLIAIGLTYVLKSTPFGRELYAIGGNVVAARLVGIKTENRIRMVYVLSGILAAFGGVMMACRFNSGQPTIGTSWVMSSITAAVIGGTSMSGGVGTMFGTIIGALMMTELSNSIVVLNISQYWEQVMTGGVVLIAVAIDAVRSMARSKS